MGVTRDWVKFNATPWERFITWLFAKQLKEVQERYLDAIANYDNDRIFLGEHMQVLDRERLQYLNLLNRFRQSPPVTPTEQARADAMVREHRLAEKARKNVRIIRQRGCECL